MYRKILAELLGALLLTACVVGSGIMAAPLAGGNDAVALIANTLATMAVLAALIATLGPVSGAHFNPVISVAAVINRQMNARLANGMFDLPLLQASTQGRAGGGQWLSEVVATAGLVFVAFRSGNFNEAAWRVALWIGAAYWFTASTSFANPAITVGRALSDTFAGIRPTDVPGFIVAQIVGLLFGVALLRLLETKAAR